MVSPQRRRKSSAGARAFQLDLATIRALTRSSDILLLRSEILGESQSNTYKLRHGIQQETPAAARASRHYVLSTPGTGDQIITDENPDIVIEDISATDAPENRFSVIGRVTYHRRHITPEEHELYTMYERFHAVGTGNTYQEAEMNMYQRLKRTAIRHHRNYIAGEYTQFLRLLNGARD